MISNYCLIRKIILFVIFPGGSGLIQKIIQISFTSGFTSEYYILTTNVCDSINYCFNPYENSKIDTNVYSSYTSNMIENIEDFYINSTEQIQILKNIENALNKDLNSQQKKFKNLLEKVLINFKILDLFKMKKMQNTDEIKSFIDLKLRFHMNEIDSLKSLLKDIKDEIFNCLVFDKNVPFCKKVLNFFKSNIFYTSTYFKSRFFTQYDTEIITVESEDKSILKSEYNMEW